MRGDEPAARDARLLHRVERRMEQAEAAQHRRTITLGKARAHPIDGAEQQRLILRDKECSELWILVHGLKQQVQPDECLAAPPAPKSCER